MNMLLLVLLATVDKVIMVKECEMAPKIDGVIEEMWLKGDSVCDFIQCRPTEGEPATGPTVYLLAEINGDPEKDKNFGEKLKVKYGQINAVQRNGIFISRLFCYRLIW